MSNTPFGLGVVAELLVVTGEAEHVANPVGIGAQDVGLHGQTVAVAADHLKIRFQTFLDQQQAGGPAGHADHGGLVVGDVDRVDVALQERGLVSDLFCIASPGRSQLAGECEVTGLEDLFKVAA